jgi:Transglycosylase-like domain
MHRPEPALHRAEPGAPTRAQTKGGAVRIRIALATVGAVVVVIPVLFLMLCSSSPAASARVIRHQAVSEHKAATINFKLMSYAQAQQIAQLANYYNAVYYNAVAVSEEKSYLKEVAFYKTVQTQSFYDALLQQRAAAAAAQAQTAAAQAQSAAAAAAATPAPAAAASTGGSDATSTNTPDWACIREHESGDNYGEGGGGAYQFELATWQGLTGLPSPAEDYPPSVQDAAALKLYAQRGWEPWTTRYVCGL